MKIDQNLGQRRIGTGDKFIASYRSENFTVEIRI